MNQNLIVKNRDALLLLDVKNSEVDLWILLWRRPITRIEFRWEQQWTAASQQWRSAEFILLILTVVLTTFYFYWSMQDGSELWLGNILCILMKGSYIIVTDKLNTTMPGKYDIVRFRESSPDSLHDVTISYVHYVKHWRHDCHRWVRWASLNATII